MGKSKTNSDSATTDSRQLSLFDIAQWPDHMRGMPNDFGRSALFTARNRSAPREELENQLVFHSMKDVKLTYTGTELRAYDDELVWMQVLHYSQRVPLGEAIVFTLYEFLKALDWPTSGQYYAKVEECLTRLQRTAIKFSSKRVGLESISLIRRFGFRDVDSRRQSKSTCQVWLEPEIVKLFADDHYSKIIWNDYRALSPVARRMYDYFSSHREPYPLSLKTFQAICKTNSEPKKWREITRRACTELSNSQLIAGAYVNDDDMICCDR